MFVCARVCVMYDACCRRPRQRRDLPTRDDAIGYAQLRPQGELVAKPTAFLGHPRMKILLERCVEILSFVSRRSRDRSAVIPGTGMPPYAVVHPLISRGWRVYTDFTTAVYGTLLESMSNEHETYLACVVQFCLASRCPGDNSVQHT